MQNKLVQKIPGFVRFDQFLLLNFPRLWLSRVHVVVTTAGIAFVILLLFTVGVIRPALVPSYTAMLEGPDYGCLGKPVERERVECALPAAYGELQRDIASQLTLMDIIVSIIGILLALLWVRAQSRYSVEAMHGRSHWYSAWVEWACYALCIGLILGAGWVIRIGLIPTPTQIDSFYQFQTTPYGGLEDYRLPKDLTLSIHLATVKGSSYSDTWEVAVEPNSPEAAHLQQLADTAYARAMGVQSATYDDRYGYDTSPWQQFVPWLLVVGYGAYILYASKRLRWVHIFVAFLISNVLVFVGLFILLFGLSLIFSMIGGRTGDYILLAILVGSVTLGLIITGIQWIRALLIQRFSVNAALGTIALPWVLAFVPLVILAVSMMPEVENWLGWEWKSRQQTDALMIGVGIAPYLCLPIMPLLDKALVRLGTLPTER